MLILAGDIGSGEKFGECLTLFDDISCRKALIPGNHDIWVHSKEREAGIDSLKLYQEILPKTAAEHGFHYLDDSPLIFPDSDLAIVGTINWYDYSWGIEGLRKDYPEEEHRLQSKRFPRGRHNDFNYVKWPLNDVSFTALVVEKFARHLEQALREVSRVVVVTHHPPFYTLGWKPREEPVTLDRYLWDAFIGNQALEDLLLRHSERITFAFAGHTHRERQNNLGSIRGYNVGGDYHYKRLLQFTWPDAEIVVHQFGDPNVLT